MLKRKKKDCCDKPRHHHPDHSAELKKLNRISGQVEGVKKMVGERRYCPDIITQLRAIKAAVKSVEANILEEHLRSCITEALRSEDKKEQEKKISELKEIFKRFD